MKRRTKGTLGLSYSAMETRSMPGGLVAWYQTTPHMDMEGIGVALPTIECHITHVHRARPFCLLRDT